MALQACWRVSVQVPEVALAGVRAGILAVDTLAAGGYDSGMFEQHHGIEQFRPLPGSHPALGQVGQCQRVDSCTLSFHLPRDAARLQHIVEQGIKPHHPWHSPLIEVLPVWLHVDQPDQALDPGLEQHPPCGTAAVDDRP